MRTISLLILLFFSTYVSAQKKYKWSQVMAMLTSVDSTDLTIKSIDSLILDIDPDQYHRIKGAKHIVNRRIVIEKPKLRCSNPVFFYNMQFKKQVHLSLNNPDLEFFSWKSVFESEFEVNAEGGNSGSHIVLDRNEFKSTCSLNVTQCGVFAIIDNIFNLGPDCYPKIRHVHEVQVERNEFRREFLVYNQDNDWLDVDGNNFEKNLRITGFVNDRFSLTKNTFNEHVFFGLFTFPTHSDVEWNDIKTAIAVGDSTGFYNRVTVNNLKSKKSFKQFIEIHKTLYDVYKSKGDLESSNAVFVAAKDIEGDRMRVLYELEGGFKNYFAWKLNRLMKFYTNHATEPALALVVSVYILLGFAVFYFFFPSEWDVESKSKLIQHYRDFIKKNDKGYVKPFLKMTWGFIVSLTNAFTLSLNSFITLGFGNIPTKGLARYVCIVQGFIGWFLLSIFTVALFNQVLF